MVVKFTNVNTGRVTNNTTFENNQIHVTLPEGMYHIIMEGFIQYKREGESHEGLIRGYEESVNISGTTASLATELFISQTSSDFIIAEIFYTGTVTEKGQQYNGDKYIKIYNNTDKVLYADGLSILGSHQGSQPPHLVYPNNPRNSFCSRFPNRNVECCAVPRRILRTLGSRV